MTSETRLWDAANAFAGCKAHFERLGMKIEPTVDPEKVAWSAAAVGKPYLTPLLDPARNDFTENNYFWLVASRDSQPVIVGGGRVDEFGACGHKALCRQLVRAYGQSAIQSVNREVATKLYGRVCYLGDLYSKAGMSLGRRNVRFFLGVANYISSCHFRAGATYSFMRNKDVQRGSADTNGFDQRIYEPVKWGDVPEARCDTEIIVYRDTRNDSSYFNEIRRELASRAAE